MIIRRYREKDFDSLAEIHDGARKQNWLLLIYRKLLSLFPLRRKEKNYSHIMFMLRKFPIRSSVLSPFPMMKSLGFYVDTASFRKGIGKKLVEFALNNTSENVTIEVLSGNSPALNLIFQCWFHYCGNPYRELCR